MYVNAILKKPTFFKAMDFFKLCFKRDEGDEEAPFLEVGVVCS